MYLIASWGSSGAGKTTVSVALASAFARKKRDVLVISTDSRTPSLPVFLPSTQGLTTRNSVAELLSKKEFGEGQLKDRIVKHPQSEHIYFMGLVSGEIAAITHGPPTREAVINLLQLLQQAPFDYIIVDCDSSPILDITTLIALEWSNYGICTLSPDVKGYEFWKAQKAWLSNHEMYQLEKFTKILNGIDGTVPEIYADKLYGGVSWHLPYNPSVRNRFSAGELILGKHPSTDSEFERKISQLASHIEEVRISGQQ